MEMLVVVAMVGGLTAVLAPALWGMAQGSALQQGGNLLISLIEQARQTAVSKNTMSALVLLADAETEQDYRAFTLLEYGPEAGWTQVRDWQHLPEGVMVDFSAGESSFLTNSPAVFPLLQPGQSHPPLRFQGRPLLQEKGYAACIFMPSGALQKSDLPAQLRLVSGFSGGNKVAYTHRLSSGKPANYFDVAIVGITGAVKVSRP